jgi:hypothetical protein
MGLKCDLLIPKMSNVLNQAEASNPLQKKMRECTICKNPGFNEQMIHFKMQGKIQLLEKSSGNQ